MFGSLRDGSADADYAAKTDAMISAYGLQDEAQVLFFDIDQPYDAVKDYMSGRGWGNVSVFTGGAKWMWDKLPDMDNVTTPVIFYVDGREKIISADAGARSKTGIAEKLTELLGHDFAGISGYSDDMRPHTLADARGGDYNARRAAIEAYWEKLRMMSPPAGYDYDPYLAPPLTFAPYAAGTLRGEYIDYALTALNFTRFLAGLPDDVTAADELNELAGHGALLMAASGYGHEPPRPADMDDTLYERGLRGTMSGNIAFAGSAGGQGLQLLGDTVIHGWIADSGEENLRNVGHRRWFFNPDMLYTGFGLADSAEGGWVSRFADAYASDVSRGELVVYQAIAYPSGAAFPSDVFRGDYPWSVTLNPEIYAAPDIDAVTVELSGGGASYTFSKENSPQDGNYSDGDYFNVDTGGYGVTNCIIFRPGGIDAYSGEYAVTVRGIKTIGGEDAELRYTVRFFQLDP
jgi:hypothetical protein